LSAPAHDICRLTAGQSRSATARGRRAHSPATAGSVAASFVRLSEESRYRRFFTTKGEPSEADLDYLVDVDHRDHYAIGAIDPKTDDLLRSAATLIAADVANVASTLQARRFSARLR
jgi:hypothetical protein